MAHKEIRNKIDAIKKTQKITNAMQMVAASKIKKAQKLMETSRPYAKRIQEVMAHVANSNAECLYPFWRGREKTQRVGYILIATDRGLCGGLNVNLFRKALEDADQWRRQNIAVDWCLFGSKAKNFFKSIAASILAQTEKIGDRPTIANLVGGVRVILKAYEEGTLDRVFIVHNEFISKVRQQPVIMQFLPVPPEKTTHKYLRDYIYEPDAKQLLHKLLVRYLEMQVYQAVVSNIACEQAARMVAMKNATDSAAEILDDLNLIYNKARQEAITRELADIVGGVAALE